ncbi:nucleotide exchange factor SIL1 isoform X2 [Paroedura picta]|uniref:nucleotide exchange factor SIL1 isoform X2 n=1 Tax=Paroedura picta TaxID=143630 RepID=UPI004057CA43
MSPPSVCFPSVVSKLSLVVLLLFAISFPSCLSDRVTELALSRKEDSDLKEQNKKEVVMVEEEEFDPEDMEVFYPTHQWQTVRPGQALPAGLHVQLNLQTGERLAKLPDDENENSHVKDPSKNKRLGPIDLDPSSFTTRELKKALAKMKESMKEDDMLEEKAHQEDVRRRFRPIEKLKEEFRELNMQLETDFEIMSKLINRFNSTTSTLEEKIAALYDLEYYVHQVDNAKDLLSLGGLQLLINGLNSTEPLLKEYASFVLGAALSSNPRVQVAAVDGGALQKLLLALATDQSLGVRKKLLLEESQDDDDHMQERTQQYNQVNLGPAIVEQGWCTIISDLLKLPKHDTREKVLKTVHVLLALCRDDYKGDHGLNHTLSRLRLEYEELVAEEQEEGDEDGYFKELLSSINSIAQQLK